MRKVNTKTPILFFSVILSVIAITGISAYYFFFYPKQIASSFTLAIGEDLNKSKQDVDKLEVVVSSWDELTKGNSNKTIEDLRSIKINFSNLSAKSESAKRNTELEELYKAVRQFSQSGQEVAENLESIAIYFKKVESAVKAFNNLNTDSKSLEKISNLVTNFKNISEQSLTELEKVAPPKMLVNLDKDYKDLLRQYIKSANDLNEAIGQKDTKKIETVGRESDDAVNSITKQLDADMAIFKESSSFSTDILGLRNLRKLIDENLGRIKSHYNF